MDFDEILKKEIEAISSKRRKCNPEDGVERPSNLFGIALSGGGIRSATLNLGVLDVLNKCGILPLADYISSVSGGGYIGGYVHAKLRRSGSTKESYKELFTEEDIKHFSEYGYYLTPGKGFIKEFLNKLRFAGVFAFSLLMNWIWVFSLFFTLFFFLQGTTDLIDSNLWAEFGYLVCLASIITLAVHFFCHGLRHIKLWPYNALYYIEGVLLFLALVYIFYLSTDFYPTLYLWKGFSVSLSFMQFTINLDFYPFLCPRKSFLVSLGILILTGFFANPNILTVHRFYRDRIAEAYLGKIVKNGNNIKLSELNPGKEARDWGAAPYPLINTCLNVLDKEDKSFPGSKTSDYFLLSPLFCGSRLTGYTDSISTGYKHMSLPTAVAISGAAVNPDMGTRTNRVLAFFMTLLNLRLGYWTFNPKPMFKSLITWWPYYHVMELLSKTNTKRQRVNISDGGHIENLGIYELLERRCRLIIAIDASADPEYAFPDLSNLVIRARNELGISIEFRKGLEPETIIKPSPSSGFSVSNFAIADIKKLQRAKGEEEDKEDYTGLLVYMKSSMRATDKYKTLKESRSFQYKTYHPAFPHESTADQFFDEDQWKAYYNLGRFMVGDLLKTNVPDEEKTGFKKCGEKTINELYEVFDRIRDSEDIMSYLKPLY